MHLRTLQTNLPWTIHYHHDFRATPMAHKDFAHALVHVVKAAGILSELVNRAEHAGCDFIPEDTDRYVADLVVCALRMANTCPGRTIDLERAVIERIESKNGVKLPPEEFPVRVIVDNTHTENATHLKAEIGKLADWFNQHASHKIREGGAVDNAIRLLNECGPWMVPPKPQPEPTLWQHVWRLLDTLPWCHLHDQQGCVLCHERWPELRPPDKVDEDIPF